MAASAFPVEPGAGCSGSCQPQAPIYLQVGHKYAVRDPKNSDDSYIVCYVIIIAKTTLIEGGKTFVGVIVHQGAHNTAETWSEAGHLYLYNNNTSHLDLVKDLGKYKGAL